MSLFVSPKTWELDASPWYIILVLPSLSSGGRKKVTVPVGAIQPGDVWLLV